MKRTHKEIMKNILKILKDGKYYHFGSLERKINTNWKTIRAHCESLEFFNAITIDKEKGVKITKLGIELSKKL